MNVEVEVQIEPPVLNKNLDQIVKEIRKVVKYFRQSQVRNDTYLQPLVIQSFGKELKLHLDVVTRWNSLIKMCERFYKLRTEIEMACIRGGLDFPLTNEDLQKVHELCQALIPVKFATKMLSKGDADLLYADQMIQFVLEELNGQNSIISQEVKEAFEKRVLARRNTKVVHLMEYFENPRFLDQHQDYFKQRIVKSEILKLATNLIKRLFPSAQDTIDQVEAEATNQEPEPEPDQDQNQSGNLGKKFEQFMKRDRFALSNRRPQAATPNSTDFYGKLVEKEMQLYKIN